MDLTTKYMGLTLPGPLVAGASPLSEKVENVKALAEAGAGAVVMHSLFEEQLTTEQAALDYYLEQGTEQFAEASRISRRRRSSGSRRSSIWPT